MSNRMRGVLVALLTWAFVACSDGPAGPNPAIVAVEVAPAGRTLTVGDTLRLTAYPKTANGDVLNGMPIEWESSNQNIASLNANGTAALVSAKQPGNVIIKASAAGKTGQVQVNVEAAPLQVGSVELISESNVVEEGQQLRLDALVRAPDGTVLTGRQVTWQTSDTTVATLQGPPDGAWALLIAHKPGQVLIGARVEGKFARRPIQVVIAAPVVGSIQIVPAVLTVETGQTAELKAFVYDNSGLPLNVPVTWHSSDAATGSVSDVTVDARATFSAHRAGQVTITAQAGIRTAQAIVTVKNPIVVTNIYVENRAIWAGQSYKLHVTVMATGGTPAVAWSIEDPTIAEIDAQGVVRGIRPGTTRAIATSGGKVGYGTVKVYANISGETVLQLQPGMDMGGFPRVVIEIGTTTWTDANGVQHPAKQWLWAGSITLRRGTENTYEQRLEIHTVVPVAGSHTQVVAVDTLIDRGIVWYDLIQADKHYLVSTTNPGRQLTAQFFQAGRMIVWQQIGTAPLLDYVYDIKQ